jgi:hypothetical protein
MSIQDKNLFCALELSAEWFMDNLYIAQWNFQRGKASNLYGQFTNCGFGRRMFLVSGSSF